MKRLLSIIAIGLMILCLLSCGMPEATPATIQQIVTTAPVQSSTTPETAPQPGWQEHDDLRYYLNEDGSYATGWLELNGQRYYLDAYGILQTGWLEDNGHTYFLRNDGTMARGETVVDGETYHFASNGQRIIVVNPENSVPADYEPDLVTLSSSISTKNIKVDSSCYEPLLEMIADCNNQHPSVCVVSGYRTRAYQTNLHNRKIRYYLDQGYSEANAQAIAATVVAVPGTSEHELGLAVDIIDTRLWELTEAQASLPAQQWLMENSWRYGFILRYPQGKSEITGIIYEPWHYRYVGKEVAKELYESGMTLEEYFESLQK